MHIALLSLAAAHAAPTPDYPVTLAAGLAAVAGPGAEFGGAEGALSAGGLGRGRLLVHWHSLAADLAAGEGLVASDLRQVGAISFGLRWSPGAVYTRASFMHLHEVPWAVVEDDPVLSTIGSAEGIRHRSGLELAVGLLAPLLPQEVPGQRLGAYIELATSVFPDDYGPRLYGAVETGLTLSVGRDRSTDP